MSTFKRVSRHTGRALAPLTSADRKRLAAAHRAPRAGELPPPTQSHGESLRATEEPPSHTQGVPVPDAAWGATLPFALRLAAKNLRNLPTRQKTSE